MDSRKILEIYKRINDRRPKPVSEFPSIDDIPPGMVVLDSDGVVKEKVGDFLIPVPVTIIGSGTLASAPDASLNDGLYFYDNVTNNLYQSINGEWVGVNAWLAVDGERVLFGGEQINVGDPNFIIYGED